MQLNQLTRKTVLNFLKAHDREILDDINLLEPHIKEQVLERCVLAKECLERGSCKICGCSTPELFYGDDPCHNNPPCYEQMLNKEDWLKLKNEQTGF